MKAASFQTPTLTAVLVAMGASLPMPAVGEEAWFTPPSAGGAQPAPEAAAPADAPLALGLSTATTLAPPQIYVPKAAMTSPQPAPPPASPRLRVDVGAAFTVRNTDNPPVGVSANVLGADPSGGKRVAVAGQSPYALPAEARTPDREVGIGLTYEMPGVDDKTIAITGTFARSSYSPTQPLNESKGTATVRIGF